MGGTEPSLNELKVLTQLNLWPVRAAALCCCGDDHICNPWSENLILVISDSSFFLSFFQRGDLVKQEDNAGNNLYHEGFFWKCIFEDNMGDHNLIWKLWFSKFGDTFFSLCFPLISNQEYNYFKVFFWLYYIYCYYFIKSSFVSCHLLLTGAILYMDGK